MVENYVLLAFSLLSIIASRGSAVSVIYFFYLTSIMFVNEWIPNNPQAIIKTDDPNRDIFIYASITTMFCFVTALWSLLLKSKSCLVFCLFLSLSLFIDSGHALMISIERDYLTVGIHSIFQLISVPLGLIIMFSWLIDYDMESFRDLRLFAWCKPLLSNLGNSGDIKK